MTHRKDIQRLGRDIVKVFGAFGVETSWPDGAPLYWAKIRDNESPDAHFLSGLRVYSPRSPQNARTALLRTVREELSLIEEWRSRQ